MGKKLIDTFVDTLDEASYDELEQLVKDIKSYSKDRQAGAKEAISENARASIKENDEVCVIYKGEEIFGTVTRVGDKTFSVEIEIDGKLVKVPRQYHMYVGHTDTDTDADEGEVENVA